MTEAPDEEPEEATEAPEGEPEEATEEPAEETTEEPADTVTEAPEEEPAETMEAPEGEPEEATEAPEEATEEPTEETAETIPPETPEEEPEETDDGPEEIIEDVILEDEDYEDIEGSVSLNDSGSPLGWTATVDGVPVSRTPRLQKKDDSIRVSLDDMTACLEGWSLTDNVNTIVLEAEGYTIAFYNEEAGISATRDGLDIEVDPDKVSIIGEGHFIDTAYLAELLNGTAEWDAEENTLMLRIPSKEALSATD